MDLCAPTSKTNDAARHDATTTEVLQETLRGGQGEEAPQDVSSRASYERYTQPDAPFQLASSGDVQLLSFLWLQKRAKEGKELPRRQDLPPEAFADMDALRKAHDDLPPHIRAAVLPMLSVSYCWLEPGHPDPDGKQLRHVVETLDKYLVAGGKEPWYWFFPDMAVFWDWGSIYQKDPKLFHPCCGGPGYVPPEKRSDAERAAAEAYETSRSMEEKESFSRALHDTMDVWYAHQMITTIFVTRIPEGNDHIVYDDRGWPFFERTSAELIKPSTPYVVEDGRPLGEGRWLWPMRIDSSADGRINKAQRPPIAPITFEREVRKRTFTNAADVSGVASLFEKTATQVLRETKKIFLRKVPVQAGDGERLAHVLSLCSSIEELIWIFTDMPAEEAEAMLASPIPTLRNLSFQDAKLTGSIPASLGSCVSLQWLHLYNNQLTGSIPASLGSCVSLQKLFLNNNQLTGSIPASLGSCASLQELFLSNNQLTGSIPASLGSCVSLQKLGFVPADCAVLWASLDPVRRCIDFYPRAIAQRLEAALGSGEDRCVLGADFFNATVHLPPDGGFCQTTPGQHMGRSGYKAPGFRSACRIVHPRSARTVTLHGRRVQGEWRLAESGDDAEYSFVEVAPAHCMLCREAAEEPCAPLRPVPP